MCFLALCRKILAFSCCDAEFCRKSRDMKKENEFERVCSLLLDEAESGMSLPAISLETENMFYETFGMSAEDICGEICK